MSMARKIPSTMVSQHPDHAGKPYWHSSAFIRTQDEVKECYLAFSDLGVDEYKWDWEGKFVDEAVIERLLGDYFHYFKTHPLGKEKFLTFRLPNPKVETEFRLGRALMGILSASGLAKQAGLHSPPLFEVILPMTQTAKEMIAIQEAFAELADLKHPLHKLENGLKHIELIPLFEQVETLMNSDRILVEYFARHRKAFGFTPEYLRPYVARSDPALNSGLVPTILAIKIALSHYRVLEGKTGVSLYPIIGSASLPFRGGLTVHTVEDFAKEYRGIKTALLQSAFRYDYPKASVKQAIRKLEKLLPGAVAQRVSSEDEERLRQLIPVFEAFYRATVESAAPLVNEVAKKLPPRRERVQHVGLFGYSRGVGKVTLPRAIGFTAALYSLGIPPELIGTGRGLRYATMHGQTGLIEKYYRNIRFDLTRAGKYLNKEMLKKLASKKSFWTDILEDVASIEAYLGHELGPVTREEKEHYRLAGVIHERLRNASSLTQPIEQAAVVRKSLG